MHHGRACLLSFCACAAILCFCAGCQPHGETNSLDVTFLRAQADYQEVKRELPRGGVAAPIALRVKELEENLAQIAGASQSGEVYPYCRQADEGLRELLSHAGYPSRPAVEELARQYQQCADGLAAAYDPATRRSALRLLVARTYNLLQAELEGARFGL